MYSRIYEITIFNETTFTLHRHSHNIRHGTWNSWLPERIYPGTNVTLYFTFNRSSHLCDILLHYGAIISGLKYILQIKLGKSSDNEFTSQFNLLEYLDEKRGKENKSRSSSPVNDNVNICKIYNEIRRSTDFTNDDKVDNRYIVRVQETEDGSVYIKRARDLIKKRLLELKDVTLTWNPRCVSGIDIQRIYTDVPADFSWVYKTADWLPNLRKSHRSILIRIVNLTNKHMKLAIDSIVGVSGCVLEEGIWVEYPNEEIPSLHGTEFGCKSSGFFGGTCGKCIYSVMGETGHLLFTWDQPSIGSLNTTGTHTLNSFSIIKHVEPINEATVIFHIMDSTLPPLNIWSAKLLSPNCITKGFDITSLPKDEIGDILFNSAGENKTLKNAADLYESNSIVITPILLDYYKNSLQGDDSSSEFYIKSTRSFLNNIKLNDPTILKDVSADSLILLEWVIGNEKFYKIFHQDEKIDLKSASIGGFPDNSVIMSSYLLRFDFDRPEIFNKLNKTEPVPSPRGTMQSPDDSYIEKALPETHKITPFLKNLDQSELLEYVMSIFNSLCDVFQPFINSRLIKKIGPDWIKKCKIPSCHIWKVDDNVRIDIEGIIYLTTAYWMEIFEDVLDDLDYLQTIQSAAIYWANQELNKFTVNYVWEVLEATRSLLQKLKAENSLKHIEFISQRLVEQ